MEKIRNFLSIDERVYSPKVLLLLILVAYLFSIAVRYIWVYYMGDNPQFFWNNQLMINTNDGYAWAEGARDILAGGHQAHDGSFIDYPASQLTAFFARVLPFSFETIILYLPAFLGSLLVVPIVLIGRLLKNDKLGFIAALFAGITWSYYNRTMIGYYDTDMLAIVLPTFLLWSIMVAMVYKSNRYLLLSTLIIVTYQWWYDKSYSLNMAMVFVVFFYTLLFDKKNLFNYKLIIFIFIGILDFSIFIKLPMAIALFGFFSLYKERADKFIFFILGGVLFLMLVTGGLNPIFAQIKGYLFREAVASDISSINLHYFNVVQTVREAGKIPFEVFANRISGSITIFILSSLGYLLLALRYRIMWIALPMIGLGFLAMKGGLRFTVYAVPINAMGIAFVILLISKYLGEKRLQYVFITLATIAVIYPNIVHVIGYKVPTVFAKDEVKVLDKLKQIASREDYVVAWWDYGYPIRYYADVKTLIDGARHSGNGNFPVSFSLLRDKISGANMARTYVEGMERSYEENSSIDLKKIIQEYQFNSVDKFLSALKSKEFKTPKKSRDIYFYLPFKMMNILPTVDLFSNMNLMTGQRYQNPTFYRASPIRTTKGAIYLNNGMEIQGGYLKAGKQILPINQFVVTEYDNQGVLHKSAQRFSIGASIYIIFMKNYNQILILDKRMFNSTYIQLFVLESYDEGMFEPTILTPMAKVFKLKI